MRNCSRCGVQIKDEQGTCPGCQPARQQPRGESPEDRLFPERPAHPVADSIPDLPEPGPLTPALHQRDIKTGIPIFSLRGFLVGFVGTFLVVVPYVVFTADSTVDALCGSFVLSAYVGGASGLLVRVLVALRELVVGEEEPPNPALRALQEEDEDEDIFDEDYGHPEESGEFTQPDHSPEPADDWYDAMRDPSPAIKRPIAKVTEEPPRRSDDQHAQEERED